MPKRTAHERGQPAVAGGDAADADEDFPDNMVFDDSSDTGEELDSQSDSAGEELGTGLSGPLPGHRAHIERLRAIASGERSKRPFCTLVMQVQRHKSL